MAPYGIRTLAYIRARVAALSVLMTIAIGGSAFATATAPTSKQAPASPPLSAPAPGTADDAVVASALRLKHAAALAREGKFAEAEKDLVEADRIRPDYAPGLMQLSNARYRLGKKTEALADLEHAMRRGTSFDDKAWLLAARIFSEQRAFIEGQKRLSEWGANRPVSANFHAALGLLKLGAMEIGPSEIEFRRALDIDPANDAALGGMFQLYSRVGQYAKLQPFLDKGLKAKPDAQGLLMLSGNALMRQERWSEARERFDRAIALDPKNAAALINRGSALHHLGDGKAAIEDYRKGIALDPKSVEGPINLATALEAENRPAEARDVLLAARKRGLEDVDLLNALTVAYDLNNEVDQAIATARLSLERDQSQAVMHKVLSRLEAKKSAPVAPRP